MKKKYQAPVAQLQTLQAQSPLLLTLSGNTGKDTPGIGIGGSASEKGLPDPEAKSQNAWNTWEEW